MSTRPAEFLKKFLAAPDQVGALTPATPQLARTVAMATLEAWRKPWAANDDRAAGPPVRLIELGGGTGALTRKLCALNPIVVERDLAWAEQLRRQFPALEVRAECATQTLADLAQPVGIVSSIPLLISPEARQIEQLLAQRYAEGLVKFCVLYTYGLSDPLRQAGFRHGVRRGFVARSLPPASVWVYR